MHRSGLPISDTGTKRLEVIRYKDLYEIFSCAIFPGDCVLVHAAFKSLGFVDGGPDTLIDALIETVGKEGTLVMPTATTSFSRSGFFDMNRSPSESGLLSEVFRQRKDVLRSSCPMTSFAAVGRHAQRFTCEFDSYLDESSPLRALLELNGKIVLYGVDYNKCTLYHLSEERHRTSYNAYRQFDGRIVDETGRERQGGQTYFVRKSLETKKDPRAACRPFDASAEVFLAGVNQGQIRVFQARKFDDYCMTVIDRDNRAFLVDQPDRES